MAGVTVVGTLPWFRRRGHLRKIMEADFKRRYEQRMEPIAGPARVDGGDLPALRLRRLLDGRALPDRPEVHQLRADASPRAEGTWREGNEGRAAAARAACTASSRGRATATCIARRRSGTARCSATSRPAAIPAGFGPSLLAVYEEDGEPKGYVAYAAKFLEDSPPTARARGSASSCATTSTTTSARIARCGRS